MYIGYSDCTPQALAICRIILLLHFLPHNSAPSHTTLPVRVSGSVRAGFTAEFTPVEVGAHTIIVNYNDSAVSGTPFTCKVYDAAKVGVSHLPRGAIGKSLQFVGETHGHILRITALEQLAHMRSSEEFPN